MKTINGWGVYLKVKELSDNDALKELHIDHIVDALDIKKEQVREYLTALATLEFIKFTDHSKEVFVMTELGRA